MKESQVCSTRFLKVITIENFKDHSVTQNGQDIVRNVETSKHYEKSSHEKVAPQITKENCGVSRVIYDVILSDDNKQCKNEICASPIDKTRHVPKRNMKERV